MGKVKYEEKELAYYEKESYMQAACNEYNADILISIVDRVNSIEGVEVLGTIDDVSDWVVYTENGTITPANVYLLDEE